MIRVIFNHKFMVNFKVDAKDLLKTLKMANVSVHGKDKKALSTMCEITVTNGKVTFAVPGVLANIPCKTQGTCKAAIHFLHFLEVVKDLQTSEIEFTITDGFIKMNNITISAKTTFFENDRILRTIRLPMNYTDVDIINLKNSVYTQEELEFNNMTFLINQAEENLKANLLNAYNFIKLYGVKYAELEKLVKSKLNVKKEE